MCPEREEKEIGCVILTGTLAGTRKLMRTLFKPGTPDTSLHRGTCRWSGFADGIQLYCSLPRMVTISVHPPLARILPKFITQMRPRSASSNFGSPNRFGRQPL